MSDLTADQRADLIFDIADVLNEHEEECGDTEAVRRAALGIVQGWNSE